MISESDSDHDGSDSDFEVIRESITGDQFARWYQERQFRQNIQNGTPYFNQPNKSKPPTRHSPSSLLQCHRKIVYKQLNAPEETEDPEGIFWIGSRFEEDVALPFLRESVVGPKQYVTNSLWVDFTVKTDAGEIQIKGETDPVIVDQHGEPLVLTEIKTKRSVADVESPNDHHRAQAHAYMRGLSEKYDQDVTDGFILYGGRTNLDVRAFHIEFDPWFWRNTVAEWAEKHTEYRLRGELPPADPEYPWECKFCSYRERCGEGETDYGNLGPVGLIPDYVQYPREKVLEFLRSKEGAKLPPLLADEYPKLAEKYGAYDWECEVCGSTAEWEVVSDNYSRLPECRDCDHGKLRGPDIVDYEHSGRGDLERGEI